MHPFISRLVLVILALTASADGVAAAAESGVATQDLVAPKASGKVNAAYWMREEDSYTLQLMVPIWIGNTIACLRGLDPTFGARTTVEGRQAPADQPRQPDSVNVADALLQLVPRHISTYEPVAMPDYGQSQVAGTLVVMNRPPKVVQVWLLRTDGTQIVPIARSAYPVPANACEARARSMQTRLRSGRFDDEITFRFSVTGSEQAVAVAIRIDDDYYIEKLQRLDFNPTGQ